MFEISKVVVARLSLAGLESPPDPEGFSITSAKSYFEDAGVDVSLIWISSELYNELMAQHRENLATPKRVTVRSIRDYRLGAVDASEVIYWKASPFPDLENEGRTMTAYEATWQYIWIYGRPIRSAPVEC